MAIRPEDILFYGGGAALQKYGTLSRRVQPLSRGGEDVIETFTRAGAVGSWVDRSGVIHTAATNVPRINHWNVHSGAAVDTPLLLIEAARTNLCTDSEDFSAAAWTNTNTTDSTNADTAPDGATTADRVIEDAGAAIHSIHDGYTGTDSVDHCVSVFAKAGSRSNIYLEINSGSTPGGGNNYVGAWFDLSAGTVGSNDAGSSGTHTRSYIEKYGSSWYRCVLVADTGTAGIGSRYFHVGLCTQDNERSYTGDGSSYVVLWGAQIEDNVPFASSYIPASGGAATRNEERCYFSNPQSPEELTTYAKFIEHGTHAEGLQIMNIGSGGSDCRFLLQSSGTYYQFLHVDGGGTVTSTIASGQPSVGDAVELLGYVSPTGAVTITQSIEGAASTSGTESAAKAFDTDGFSNQTIDIGGSSGAAGYAGLDAIIVTRGSHALAEFRNVLP
jgi:hypothetical protein